MIAQPTMPPIIAPNESFKQLASPARIERAAAALEAHGIHVKVAKNGAEAQKMVLDLLPEGAEVYAGQSVTLTQLGLVDEIDNSGRFNAVRPQVMALDRKTQGDQMRALRTRPAYMVGSVHAVTEDGRVLIASNSGSQIAAYAAGAGKVIWVVGAQKFVKDLDEGLRRIDEYSLPLEDVRLRAQYGIPSFVSKVLIVNREFRPNRITMIIVKEAVGF
jgi:hypothetical protein